MIMISIWSYSAMGLVSFIVKKFSVVSRLLTVFVTTAVISMYCRVIFVRLVYVKLPRLMNPMAEVSN